MPLACDPDAVAEYWLKTDENKPAEKRPTFLFRFMSRREHHRVEDLRARAVKEKDDAECFKMLADAILTGLVGWRNIFDREGKPIPYSRETWDAPLTPREIWEMAWNFPAALMLSESDKKKSASQSHDATAASAPSVAADNATTSPPPPNP